MDKKTTKELLAYAGVVLMVWAGASLLSALGLSLIAGVALGVCWLFEKPEGYSFIFWMWGIASMVFGAIKAALFIAAADGR